MSARVRSAWRENRPALGAFLFTRLDPVLIEAVGSMSYDYVCIDMQHGMMDHQQMVSAIRALQPGRASAIVRVPTLDKGLIGRALDAGAMGIIVPGIESAAEAEQAVIACRYVPEGERSYGPIGAMVRYGFDYAESANERVLVIPMIETRAGLEKADEICAVPGLDAIYVGPFDLSISLGKTPSAESIAELDPTLRDLAETARRHDVVPGIHGTSAPTAHFANLGFGLITVTTDFDVITSGFRGALGLDEAPEGGY